MPPEDELTQAERIMRVMLQKRFLQHFPTEAARDTFLDFPRFLDIAKSRSAEYQNAKPFPHVVIDDFLPPESFERIHAALPDVHDERIHWGNLTTKLDDGRMAQANKHHLDNLLFMQPDLRLFLGEINCGPFTLMLQELTGIEALVADNLLQGGGVHMVERGGLLRVHADYRLHPNLYLNREVNLLLYMNKDWQEDYGGHLELWNDDMSECVQRILPIANRCVIFNTTDDSYHGHPHPLTCPTGTMRQSIATYYFTAKRPPTTERVFGTDWQNLPSERD